MTYALRGCSCALLAGSNPRLASYSQVATAGDSWLLMAVRGHLGDIAAPGLVPLEGRPEGPRRGRLRSWTGQSG